MLNESVVKVLKNNMWDLATCTNNEPNVVPVAFKDVTNEGKLVIGDVFLETTLNNLKENDQWCCNSKRSSCCDTCKSHCNNTRCR